MLKILLLNFWYLISNKKIILRLHSISVEMIILKFLFHLKISFLTFDWSTRV